jgi:hypothetical protein
VCVCVCVCVCIGGRGVYFSCTDMSNSYFTWIRNRSRFPNSDVMYKNLDTYYKIAYTSLQLLLLVLICFNM